MAAATVTYFPAGSSSVGGIVGTVTPLAAPADSMAATSLTPTTQLRYEITGRVVFPAGVATVLTVDLNGIAAATWKPNTTTHQTNGTGDTSINIAATQNQIDATGAGHTATEMYFQVVVQAKSGEGPRYFYWEAFRQSSTATIEAPTTCRGFITDTSTEITTITLNGGTGGIGTGSWMRVRALA